jgi:hypothetical protein
VSLAIWFDLGGDASLVVGVVTVRVVTLVLITPYCSVANRWVTRVTFYWLANLVWPVSVWCSRVAQQAGV